MQQIVSVEGSQEHPFLGKSHSDEESTVASLIALGGSPHATSNIDSMNRLIVRS